MRGTPGGVAPTATSLVPGHARGRASRIAAILAAMLLMPIVVVVGVAASGRGGTDQQTVYIDIHYSHYEPALVTVPVGVPVRIVIRNLDPIDHEWIVGDAAVHALHRSGTEAHHSARPTEVSIGALQTVETVVMFPATGTMQFICHLPGHEEYGMVGTLSIQ